MRISLRTAVTVSVAVLLLLISEYAMLPDGKFHLYVLDVDQGDSILMVTPSGKQIVNDGGPNTDLLEYLGKYMPFFDRTIELLILSHPDSDHITAIPDVLERYEIGAVLMNGTIHHSGRYEALLSILQSRHIPVILSDPGQDIVMGDGVVLDVVWPPSSVFGVDPESANNISVTVRVLYKDTSIVLTGDIEGETESAILQTGADVRGNILKVPHHGSRTSSSTGFLLAVQPSQALVSVGRDNKFGHPHQEVVNRYQQLKIPVQMTTSGGTISLEIP